jgi:cation diffusion facilitator CzcD-associated flavoprotein CzcO
MEQRLAKRPEVAKKLIPTFSVGCRRPTPGNGFLEALCEDNVEPVTKGIKRITEKGIVTEDGVEHEVDIIICATGFDV